MIRILPRDELFVLTGAGISAESGIPTFRGQNGLWRQYRIEEVASPRAWARDPALVWDFYSMRRKAARSALPNPGHHALSALAAHLGPRMFLCTQNVDDLHEAAGSPQVAHTHGQLFQSRCDLCPRLPFADANTYEPPCEIPRCECGGRIRPHICWFGEVPFCLDEIMTRLARCSVFVAIGTSGSVEPAAGFAASVRGHARRYYVGPEAPANACLFDECIAGLAGEVLPGLFSVEAEPS